MGSVVSHVAVAWAWKVEGLNPTQKLLLVALADFADENHSCFPGQVVLSRMAGVSRETVSRNLAILESAGLIVRSRRSRRDGSRSSDRFVLRVGEVSVLGSKSQCDDSSRDDSSCDLDGVVNVTQTGGHEPSVELSAITPISPNQLDPLLVAFGEFWELFPTGRKRSKSAALKSFRAAVRRIGSVEPIVAGVRRYAADPNLPDPEFRPMPQTWLNQSRWDWEPEPVRSRGRSVVDLGREADELLADGFDELGDVS